MKASRILASVTMSKNNYANVWELVCNCYEDSKELVRHHLKGLFNLPAMQSKSAASLRRLLDDFSIHVQSLKSMGLLVEHWDAMLIYLLESKLHPQVDQCWLRASAALGRPETMADLQKFLE